MELTLNHYRLALHNLPPLRPDDEIDYDTDDGPDVPDIEQGELEPNDKTDYETYDETDDETDDEPDIPDDEQGELEPNIPDDERDEI